MDDEIQRRADLANYGVHISRDGRRVDPRDFYLDPVGDAARQLGATAADRIPGLWDVPGYPELTTNQLVALAGEGRKV